MVAWSTVGTTTKIWPAGTDDLTRCLAEPAYVAHLFVRCDDYAMIHDAPELPRRLRALVGGAELREVEDANDPSFVMSREAVAALLDATDARHELVEFRSICANGVQILDLVRRAVASERGLVFCSYEDW